MLAASCEPLTEAALPYPILSHRGNCPATSNFAAQLMIRSPIARPRLVIGAPGLHPSPTCHHLPRRSPMWDSHPTGVFDMQVSTGGSPALVMSRLGPTARGRANCDPAPGHRPALADPNPPCSAGRPQASGCNTCRSHRPSPSPLDAPSQPHDDYLAGRRQRPH